MQIIFSGKAHPVDEEGKRIIQRLMEWCKHPVIRDRVAFIDDYDIFTKMKASIRTNAPLFNSDRMVADYMAQMYVPGSSTHKPTLASVPV